MYVVLVEGVDNSPFKVGWDALGVELVWAMVSGVQAFPSPSHITLINVGVAQLDDVDVEVNKMYMSTNENMLTSVCRLESQLAGQL